jgi:uncharacterized protein (TIGR03083 family)
MIETLHLFRPLNNKLLELLRSLSDDEWNKKTVAGNWTVKDVAAHLLDTNMRFISINRDHASLRPDRELKSYPEVVSYLNELNADWVKAMKRVSARQLVDLLESTHEDYISGLESLDPQSPAMFSVAWAGEKVSKNWFHIARDYTEKWHHQQQIRHAVNKPGILTKDFYKPVLDTFMRALPFKYKDTAATEGTCVKITVESAAGGAWFVRREKEGWRLIDHADKSSVVITIPVDISWQLFTKAIRFEAVKDQIKIEGDQSLSLPALQMITVMA